MVEFSTANKINISATICDLEKRSAFTERFETGILFHKFSFLSLTRLSDGIGGVRGGEWVGWLVGWWMVGPTHLKYIRISYHVKILALPLKNIFSSIYNTAVPR